MKKLLTLGLGVLLTVGCTQPTETKKDNQNQQVAPEVDQDQSGQ